MGLMEAWISEIFSQITYQPMLVYGAIWAFMLMSAFGLPIPEEVVLISAGLVGYMSLHPEKYPPPTHSSTPVDIYILAAVAFTAVMSSDYLIFYLGRKLGPKLFKMKWFCRFVSEPQLVKIKRWMWEYGSWTVFVFRFTPGVRFPGHLCCGATGLPAWKFLAVDWLAAGVSVPTQVLLVSFYGEYILKYFTQFKIYFFSTLAVILVTYFSMRYFTKRREKMNLKNSTDSTMSEPELNSSISQKPPHLGPIHFLSSQEPESSSSLTSINNSPLESPTAGLAESPALGKPSSYKKVP